MRGSNVKIISWIIVIFICACSSPQIKQGQEVAAVCAATKSSFFDACRKGDVVTVMRLVEEKIVDVNERDKYQWTGLMYAIQNGHEDLAEYFLIKKASINQQDKDGLTPLMIAVNERHPNIVELLLQAGADPVMQDKHGYTALMWAIYNKSWDSIPLLLATGKGIDLQNGFGETALHLAAYYNQPDIVSILVKKKAPTIFRINRG